MFFFYSVVRFWSTRPALPWLYFLIYFFILVHHWFYRPSLYARLHPRGLAAIQALGKPDGHLQQNTVMPQHPTVFSTVNWPQRMITWIPFSIQYLVQIGNAEIFCERASNSRERLYLERLHRTPVHTRSNQIHYWNYFFCTTCYFFVFTIVMCWNKVRKSCSFYKSEAAQLQNEWKMNRQKYFRNC